MANPTNENKVKTAFDVAFRLLEAYGITKDDIVEQLMRYLARYCIRSNILNPVDKFQGLYTQEYKQHR